MDSSARVHSYRRRGLYSLQLRNLYRFFDKENVLIIASEDLHRHQGTVLTRVFEFLGVSQAVQMGSERVFEGDWDGHEHRVLSTLLRLSYLVETVRFRQYHRLDKT